MAAEASCLAAGDTAVLAAIEERDDTMDVDKQEANEEIKSFAEADTREPFDDNREGLLPEVFVIDEAARGHVVARVTQPHPTVARTDAAKEDTPWFLRCRPLDSPVGTSIGTSIGTFHQQDPIAPASKFALPKVSKRKFVS